MEFPPSLPPKAGSPTTLSLLPSLKTMLLRSHLAKVCGKPVPKARYRLLAVLVPAKPDDSAPSSASPTTGADAPGKALEVEIEAGEEGREISWWGLQDGDTVRVLEL